MNTTLLQNISKQISKIGFMRQKMMRKVIIGLLPIVAFSTYLFGLRVLILLMIVNIFALITEYIVIRSINGEKSKISEAVFVTAFLYTLTLPPSVPYWIAIAGIIFGMLFGKMVFGGFGKNIFNPALVGRCFIYISFPAFMTNTWILPFDRLPGGITNYMNTPDAVTSVTPLISKGSEYLELILGNIPGSIGETSALLIILAGVYLIYTKTASWKIMVSTILGFISLSIVLYFTGVDSIDPLYSVLSGGVLFAIVFMTTDPISAPKQKEAKIIYGILIGIVAVIIRSFSIFTEGIMFAILIANTLVSLIDMKIKNFKDRKKVAS